ncbi:putative diguanylate cyclase AdrA [Thalassocella blandensis]|nr:putative diguanylate cyclase AdrA [Thalassocella blandensis]
MSKPNDFLNDFHWLMDVLRSIDVGLVILDKEFRIEVWNSFMQNHSVLRPEDVLNQVIFEQFPELPEAWFRRKAQSVFDLQISAFTTWEQRPYLFRFQNYRPITSLADFMYQNCTLIPLKNATGDVEHICLIIYDVTEVAVNRIQIQAANAKLHELSRTDGLTSLLNRKTWEMELDEEYRRFSRYHHSTSLIMFDIDHFKAINDNYGHPAGDEVIRETARILKENLREIDIAGRYGGEEFAVVLVNTNAEGAQTVAERIRTQVAASTVFYEDLSMNYTISLGIAELSSSMSDKTQWIDCADKALYQAKHGGRNNSVIFLGS